MLAQPKEPGWSDWGVTLQQSQTVREPKKNQGLSLQKHSLTPPKTACVSGNLWHPTPEAQEHVGSYAKGGRQGAVAPVWALAHSVHVVGSGSTGGSGYSGEQVLGGANTGWSRYWGSGYWVKWVLGEWVLGGVGIFVISCTVTLFYSNMHYLTDGFLLNAKVPQS